MAATTDLERELANTRHEIALTELHPKMHHPDFQHGFAYRYLKESRNQAFYFAYNRQIPVPPIGPKFRITLPNGDEYMCVQWGVTHVEIQREINDEPDVD